MTLNTYDVCTVPRSAGVQVAPSTYYATKARTPAARACRDLAVGLALKKLWEDNYGVCGARKLWKAARRAGHDIGRDQAARHMRAAGITGARRGKRLRTTKLDPGAPRHPDLLGRDFTAAAPNQLWGHRSGTRSCLLGPVWPKCALSPTRSAG
jgi:putative transposase